MKRIRVTDQSKMYVIKGRPLQIALYAFAAAVAGTAVGFVAAVAVVMPVVHQDIASQAKQINSTLASSLLDMPDQMSGKSGFDESVCAVPMGGQGGGQGAVMGTSTSAIQSQPGYKHGDHNHGGQGGGQPGGNTYITKLIGGSMVHETASIADTGPYSKNIVTANTTTTTTVTNTNNIDVTNLNSQNAHSGSATVANNTNAGSASTGDAANANDTSLTLHLANN